MTTTYNLEYRAKGSSTWLSGPSGLPKDSDALIRGTVGGLVENTTYEFRFQRVIGGVPTNSFSSVVEGTTKAATTVSNGGAIADTGTFEWTSTGSTVVRSAQGVQVLIGAANWVYVAIASVSPSVNGSSAFYTTKTSGNQSGIGIRNEEIITRTSNRQVEIYLDKAYSYVLTISFSGNSQGSLTINSIA